jgi:GDP-4-dehydro-6-deoxy-D-mannose reductase
MRILITGAAGFVGKYCIEHFKNVLKWEVFATKLENETISEVADVKTFDMNLLNQNSIANALIGSKPDYILHLAAQSSVGVSWKNPQITADINIKGTVNLLDSVRKLLINPKIILVGSSEEYGYLPEGVSVVSEKTPLNPGNFYAISKTAQNMTGALYARAYGMNICMTRAFNHIGAGQSEIFVASDFAKQVAMIECGLQKNVIKVGNIEAKRDFSDVRDVVTAYEKIFLKGKTGETYNIGSGKATSIKSLLETLISFSDKDIKISVDPKKLRPLDVPEVRADISKIQQHTDWTPEHNLEDTLLDVLNYWRNTVKKGV